MFYLSLPSPFFSFTPKHTAAAASIPLLFQRRRLKPPFSPPSSSPLFIRPPTTTIISVLITISSLVAIPSPSNYRIQSDPFVLHHLRCHCFASLSSFTDSPSSSMVFWSFSSMISPSRREFQI